MRAAGFGHYEVSARRITLYLENLEPVLQVG
jgi:hypothetical protein